MNLEVNESFTHTEKFKNEQFLAVHEIRILQFSLFSDRYPPYIDLLHLFVSPQNYFRLCVANGRLKRRSEKVIRAPQDRQPKAVATPHNITISNKLNLHYLLHLFQLRRKKLNQIECKSFFSTPKYYAGQSR